jgi:phosphatidylethanolamine-binding protein (PEBP) family uncharacterized protein
MKKHLAMIALLAISTFNLIPAHASDFKATFKWCSGTPEFQLSNVPKGTTKLSFVMTDLWVPSYQHGGGEFAYKNQKTVPCGALKGFYYPPSPPSPQIHDYQWSIKALDANGSSLGEAKTVRKFPEK